MPENIDISNTGNTQAVAQFGVRINREEIATLDIAPQTETEESTFDYALNAPAETSHILTTHNSDFVNRLMKSVSMSANPLILVRHGIGGPDGAVRWYPWQDHLIRSFQAVPLGLGNQAGNLVRLSTVDALGRIDRHKKTVARSGTISSIVQQIAEENGFTDTVIEETTGTFSLIQNMSDTEFLISRLVKRAQNTKGRGNYACWVLDGVLHFHSADYESTLKEINFFQQSSGYDFEAVDSAQDRVLRGSGRTRTVAYDMVEGKIQSYNSDASKALRFGDTYPDFNELENIEFEMNLHVGLNQMAELEAIGQNVYEYERSRMFMVDLVTGKTPNVQVGDILNLVIDPTRAKVSPWSGYYHVVGVKHLFQKGDMTSRFTLARGELTSRVEVFSDLQDQVIAKQFAAEGEPLNAAAIAASKRTKATRVRDGLLKTPLDPNNT